MLMPSGFCSVDTRLMRSSSIKLLDCGGWLPSYLIVTGNFRSTRIDTVADRRVGDFRAAALTSMLTTSLRASQRVDNFRLVEGAGEAFPASRGEVRRDLLQPVAVIMYSQSASRSARCLTPHATTSAGVR